MTTPPVDKGYWKRQRAKLAELAPTRTLDELLAFWPHTTTQRLREQLNLAGISYIRKHTPVLTPEQHAQLVQAPQTRTPSEWAEYLGLSVDRMYAYLTRHKIKARRSKCHSRNIWSHRRDWLAQHAPTRTLKELHALLQQELGATHTIGAIRQALLDLGIDYLRSKHQSIHRGDQARLQTMAQTMTCRQMADALQLTPKYTRRLLQSMGITPQPGEAARPPAPRKPKAPSKCVAPTVRMQTAIPSRTSIASKTPAQIIWPAHIQIQHITTQIPAHAPIRPSTMRAPYVPGKDWRTGPRSQ